MYFKRKLTFFYHFKDMPCGDTTLDSGVYLSIIKNVDDYLESCHKFGLSVSRHYQNRFASKATFYFLHSNKECLSYGWTIIDCDAFCIECMHLSINIGNDVIIFFDCRTNESHRKKGHYTKLLSLFIKESPNKTLVGYTAPSNIGSFKGITKADFSVLGTYKRLQQSKLFMDLHNKGINITKSGKRISKNSIK